MSELLLGVWIRGSHSQSVDPVPEKGHEEVPRELVEQRIEGEGSRIVEQSDWRRPREVLKHAMDENTFPS